MKRLLPLALLLSLALAGCTPRPTNQLGVITDRHYTNEHFGLTLDLPATWQLEAGDLNEMIKELGVKAFGGDDTKLTAATERAMKNTFVIFTSSRVVMGTPGVLNPNVICTVERLPLAAGVHSAGDYARLMTGMFPQSQTPITVLGAAEAEMINGVEFTTLSTSMQIGEIKILQKYRLLYREGYVLALIGTYFDEETTQEVADIFGTVAKL